MGPLLPTTIIPLEDFQVFALPNGFRLQTQRSLLKGKNILCPLFEGSTDVGFTVASKKTSVTMLLTQEVEQMVGADRHRFLVFRSLAVFDYELQVVILED